MERMRITFLALVILVCASTIMPLAAQSGSTPKDGELVFPAGYKSYAAFLHGIQKPDAVRDLYINPTGASAKAGQPFANGSILVMEIYNAKKNAEGTLEKGADGNLVKADLAKVFVMQKEGGWGKAKQCLRWSGANWNSYSFLKFFHFSLFNNFDVLIM